MPETPLRILAIGAHPDDLEFGCGGILLGEMARGSEISLCVCSRGEAISGNYRVSRASPKSMRVDFFALTLQPH